MEDVVKQKTPQVVEEETSNDSSFDRKRRIIGAICGPICALLVWITPIEGLTTEAHQLLAIMTLVALWWITEPIPIPVTSLVGPTLCVVLGVVKMKEAFAAFSNP
ncbi:MAG: anion permease, partial [Prevotella sp.]|nr:anion permease [Prevotella sp.]